MMDLWNHFFPVSIPDDVKQHLMGADVLRQPSSLQQEAISEGIFLPDSFSPDGFPVTEDPDVIYPAHAAMYTGAAIPQEILAMDPLFRAKASEAAMCWLQNLYACVNPVHPYGNPALGKTTYDGLKLDFPYGNHLIRFCFPDTHTRFGASKRSTRCVAVVPIPDIDDNNEDWEADPPAYAYQQAQVLLWCWNQVQQLHGLSVVPEEALIVRITGNLAANITVKTVPFNLQEAERIVQRIIRRTLAVTQTGQAPKDALHCIPMKSWAEKKQAALDDAYVIDDPAFYQLVQEYMAARSYRKQLEERDKDLKDRRDAIAYALAAQTSETAYAGEVISPDGRRLVVTHTRKRAYAPTVSYGLVLQYYPEHADKILRVVTPRGRITCEVL